MTETLTRSPGFSVGELLFSRNDAPCAGTSATVRPAGSQQLTSKAATTIQRIPSLLMLFIQQLSGNQRKVHHIDDAVLVHIRRFRLFPV
ncbi:hypothetical protein D3C86_1881230 [compost metagenome]